MIAVLCAVLGGAMFYLGQGLDDVWPLAWFAPVPLLWLAYGETPAWRVAVAASAAAAMSMVYLFQVYGTILGLGGVVMTLAVSVLFALATLFARLAWRRLPPVAALCAFPACWTAMEYAQGLVSPHGAWGAWGYSQVDWPAAVQPAAVTGVSGVTFLLCLFANALAMAVRGRRVVGAAGMALCLAAILGGYVRLALPAGPGMQVAALALTGDGYISAMETGDAAAAAASRVADAYAAAIRTEAASGTRFFVTPEGGVELPAVEPIEAAARDTGSIAVIGTDGHHPARNMTVAVAPDGTIATYQKRHLLLPGEAAYTPGTLSGVIGNGMAMAICKDMDFPRTIRSDAQAGIRLMATPANDFVLDDWMHARQSIMRGVENGFAVARSATNGIETISDARGQVLARARVASSGLTAIRAEVPLGPGMTPYVRFGDVFAWVAVVATVGLGAAAVAGWRRSSTWIVAERSNG